MAMLIFTVCGSFWLEIFLKIGVLRRIKRVIISIIPISTLFLIWDAYAIAQGHWFFDWKQILGIYDPFGIPLEEFLLSIGTPTLLCPDTSQCAPVGLRLMLDTFSSVDA